MDLRALLDRPTDTERQAVDDLLGPAEGFNGRVSYGGQEARAQRQLLLPALHACQDATGSVSRGALGYISERLTIPPAEVYGVATFYSLFNVDQPGGTTIHVCDDIVCSQYGADGLMQTLEGSELSWEPSPCLGQCERAPAVMFHQPGQGYGNAAPVDPDTVGNVIFDELPPGVVHQDPSQLRLLRRIGRVDPTSLEAYRESGGYQTLTRAIELGPDGVIVALDESGLKGRGGAAFPIGIKWRGVADAPGPVKYVIANGDESEPGTFKDRLLMEGDPFAVVEAMTIYGFATGSTRGYIYVRGEYPTAEKRLRDAIVMAAETGLLGTDVAGAGFDFDLEVRRGAGAYICGEETALFASIEGYRGGTQAETTISHGARCVWQTHRDQQHRDAAGSTRGHWQRARAVRSDGYRAVHGHQAVLCLRRSGETRRVRGSIWHDIGRDTRSGGWCWRRTRIGRHSSWRCRRCVCRLLFSRDAADV